MKMSNIVFILFLPFILLQGCNNATSPPPENVPAEHNDHTITNNGTDTITNNGTDTTVKGTENKFNFTKFELDVDYARDKSYEVDYDYGIEAEIKDKIKGIIVNGDVALSELNPTFEQLKFDTATPKSEVIAEVLKAFNLKSDYTKFELDIVFLDGTKKEYNSIR
ncbi:YusW family protein [Bacillus sp. FJAT-29790]|uniref:YusW family protein n=1 Tax=Bacillus sp. FJAT-29790 TaxID=1895002 RepID=UPI001C246D71|nr:YusW family protein [Bacillus sp. FJAT-29790]MBU8877979.1 YusW family protein [Bacillus sp. FJAT-29790]